MTTGACPRPRPLRRERVRRRAHGGRTGRDGAGRHTDRACRTFAGCRGRPGEPPEAARAAGDRDRRRRSRPGPLLSGVDEGRVTTVGPYARYGLPRRRLVPRPARTMPTSPARCSSSGKAPTATTRRPRRAGPRSSTRAASTRSCPTSAPRTRRDRPAPTATATHPHDAVRPQPARRVQRGTIDSMRQQAIEMADAANAKIVADPYGSAP